jgi:6-phosphogluconolactonase
MAFAAVDHSGRYLLAASYNDDLVTVSPISGEGAAVGEPTARVGTGRHAHAVLASPDNRFVYATALGEDRVRWWELDAETGLLAEAGEALSPAGSGPRHLRFSHGGDFLYVLHEMAGNVLVYAVDRATGGLERVQDISGISPELGLVHGAVRDGSGPEPEPNAIWCAELHLVPDGSFLYSTERTSSTISIFAVDPNDGTLSYQGYQPTQQQPRGMNIDPSGQYLLACGEVSNAVSVYRIDQLNGSLTDLGSYECNAGPRWIEFAVVGA